MSFRKLVLTIVGALWATAAHAQITPTYTFSPNTVISSSEVNANFALLGNALSRTGGTITGNITVGAGVTIDGVDLSAWLDQSVKQAATPTFASLTLTNTLTVSGTGASAADIGGGLNIGTGNVALVGTDGKINGPLSSTILDDLDGTNLTGLAKLASTNTFTNRNDFKLYSETKTTPAIAAGALTVDLSAGTTFVVTLNAAITSLTLSNPVPSGTTGSFQVRFVADGTVRAVTWPASIKWVNNTAPSAMTGTNGYSDILVCNYDDGGTKYFCTLLQNFPS